MNTVDLLVSALLEDLEARLPHIRKEFPSVTNQEIDQASKADPTGSDYVQWILRLASKRIVRLPEDTDKIRQRLEQFNQLKRKPGFQGERDINRYKSYGDLAKAVDANIGVKTKGEETRNKTQSGVKHVSSVGAYDAYTVTTPEAAAKLFRNTDWCVKDPEYFRTYSPQVFTYIEKDGKAFALFHEGSYQLKDVTDEDLDPIPNEVMRFIVKPNVYAKLSYLVAYAVNILKKRWPEAEPYMLHQADLEPRNTEDFVDALDDLMIYMDGCMAGKRWREAEPLFVEDPMSAAEYAKRILKKRWPKAEPSILKDGLAIVNYAFYTLKARWPEGERALLSGTVNEDGRLDGMVSYAKFLMCGRWPEAEPFINESHYWKQIYAHNLELKMPLASPMASYARV